LFIEMPPSLRLPPQGKPAPKTAAWQRSLTGDPVLLFRYSALTFNGHRIHYDLVT
jgi:3-methylfumaryl-CoA hydratase